MTTLKCMPSTNEEDTKLTKLKAWAPNRKCVKGIWKGDLPVIRCKYPTLAIKVWVPFKNYLFITFTKLQTDLYN